MTVYIPGPPTALSPRDRAYEAYDPREDRPTLEREADGWSVYSPHGVRLAHHVGPGSKRRAIARLRSMTG